MKYLHIVPGADDVANGMARVARLLAKEQGDAEVVDLNNGKRGTGNGELGMGSGKREEFGVEGLEEVWVHGMWLPKEWAICRRVIKAGKRLVRMTHGSLSPVYLKQQGRWKKRLVGPIERYWLRRSDRIVVTCDAEKEWIEAYLGKKCPEIAVEDIKRFFDFSRKERIGRVEERGNFISRVERADRVEGDESVFNTEARNRPLRGFATHRKANTPSEARAERHRGAEKDELHLLYLGRRHPLKGVEYLERAVREISTRSTRSTRLNIELKIVSNAFGEELEKVWEWCDVLVLPTLSENFGLVVAEALERGKRVITTDGAPAWGELGNGEWGRYPPSEASPRSGCPSRGGNGEDVGGRLIYLKGFRDGSEAERVRLLKDALMMMV